MTSNFELILAYLTGRPVANYMYECNFGYYPELSIPLYVPNQYYCTIVYIVIFMHPRPPGRHIGIDG